MADDRPSDHNGDLGPSSDLNRSKRMPPTLDLAATEVSHAAAGSGQEQPSDETPPVHDPVSDSPPVQPRSRGILAGALSGAAAAAIVLGIVWAMDRPIGAASPDPVAPVSLAPPSSAVIDDLATRLAKVESRPAPVAPPAAQPAPAPDLSPLVARIAALETGLAAVRDETKAGRARSEQMLAAIDMLTSAPRETPAAPTAPAPVVDLTPINDRISQLDSALRAQATAAAAQSAKPIDDAPLRRVVAAALLDLQVRRGEPFAAALAAAKPLGDMSKLAPLEAFAAVGVPSPPALAQELLTLLPKLTSTATTTGTGLMDKLQAGAARLVKIERTDAVAGNTASAVVSRAAVAARQNDIATAARELRTLPPADRAVVQPWLDKVDARNAALAAAQQFSADAMTALSKPAP